MASFSAFFQVGNTEYAVLYTNLNVNQTIDDLSRPSSPTFGGMTTIEVDVKDDPTLVEWMFSPSTHKNAQILLRNLTGGVEKVIKYYNAYCVELSQTFDGTANVANLRWRFRISPQAISAGGVFHDNKWAGADPIVDWDWAAMDAACHPERVVKPEVVAPKEAKKAEKEPSAFSEGLHTLLDVVGMIPVVGEIADGANALIYAAEGDYANAAMSAASMIPLAGNVVGAAKLAKRGMKLVQKAKKLIPPKLIKRLDKVASAGKDLCTKVGHPIDVATGLLFTEAVDFSLPGPIPLVWERTWYSASDYQGPLGHGWHHAYDLGLALDSETNIAVLRMADGRQVAFESPEVPGQPVLDRSSGLALQRPEAPTGDEPAPWLVWNKAQGIWYVFAPPSGDGSYQPLHTIENETGQYIGFRYTANRQLEQIQDSAGRLLTAEYNEQGQLIAFYGPHPDIADERILLVGYSYDEVGNLISVADAEEHRTQFAYDGWQLIKETNALGLSFYFEYEINSQPDLPARCVHTWGDGGIIDTKLEYINPQTTVVWDSYDQPTQYVHQNGVVVEQTDTLGQIQRWVYNDYNQLLAQTDGLGQTTQFRYDETGNLISTRYADATRQQTEYDTADRPIAFTDARGSTWQYNYNEQGLLMAQTDPLGAKTAYTYDEQGRLLTVTNALGQQTNLRYDGQGNLAHLITPDEQIRSRSYDALGRLVTLTDPTGTVQTRRYDRLGQLIQVVEPDGTQRELVYDGVGNVVEARQGEQVVQFTYTNSSRLTERYQAGQRVQFGYDKEGRLTGLTNEAGLHYRFGLDASGQVVEEEGFDGLLRRYERDAAGRVTKVLRPADRSTQYSYTPAGQVSLIEYSDGTQEAYDYDESGSLIKAQNQTTTVRLKRDALGRVLRETQGEYWVEYGYDPLGQRTAITSSLGADVSLSHDVLGNISQIDAGSWQAQFGYDVRGLEVQRQLSGGIRMGWQRDGVGRPVRQRITAGGSATRQRTYAWTGTDVLTQIEDSQTGLSRYEHDIFGALTKASYADGSQELRLPDAVGNLFETAEKADREYGPGGQLLRSQQATYQYDAEGNLIQKVTRKGDVWQYEWFGNGMLARVLRPDGADVTFGYDALGRRVSKTYKGKTTHWVWEGDKPLHEWTELTLDGSNTDEVITWLFEEDSFAPIGKLQGTNRQSILTDHLGTPLEMVDQGGLTQWSAQTTSYGRVRLDKGTRADCPFRFQGQYEDVETGLYYNRFRYYDPQEGTYVSQDPIGLEGGMSLYNYVDNPSTWTDVTGLSGIPSFDELKRLSQTTLDFSTAKDSAVFWSGSRMKDAQRWAFNTGRTTLEQTKGGKYLDSLDLFNPKNGLTGSQAAEVWNIASKRFADGATGIVHVFSTGAKRFGPYGERTWWRIEKPALLANLKVSEIIRMTKDGIKLKIGGASC